MTQELNKLLKQIKGRPMNKKERALQDFLRLRVKEGSISVEEAHRIWKQRMKA